MEIILDKGLITSRKVGEWCQLEYPGHKKGCPNYGIKDWCPPHAPWVEDWIDTNEMM